MVTQHKLAPKQARFVQEYLLDLNATQAAIRAGYSERTANRIATENLSKPVIRAAIETAVAERAERTEITADRVLQELARIGFSDPRKLFDGRRLKRPEEWDDDVAASISSVEVVTRPIGEDEIEYVHKLKFWSKDSALEKLAKHTGVYSDAAQIDNTLIVVQRKEY